MNRFACLLIVAVSLITLGERAPATTVDRDCPGAGKMKASLGTALSISEMPFVDCDTTNLSYRVRKAVYQLQNPRGIIFASNRFSYDSVGFDAFKYVTDVVKHIALTTESQKTEYMIPGLATRIRSGGLENNILEINADAVALTDLELRATIVHLSAHHHAKDPGHTRCRRGPFASVTALACDASWAEGGYAAEAEYLIGQAGSPTVPTEVRAEARAAALERILYHSNSTPPWLKQGVFIYPTEGGVSFFDETGVTPLLKTLPAGIEIATNPERPTGVDRAKGTVGEFDYRQNFPERRDKFAIKQSFFRADYRDVIETGDMICALYDSKVTCQSKMRGNETLTREIGAGLKRFQWVRTKASFKPEGDAFDIPLQIIRDDGSALLMPTTFDAFKQGKPLAAGVTLAPTIPNEVDRVFLPEVELKQFQVRRDRDRSQRHRVLERGRGSR